MGSRGPVMLGDLDRSAMQWQQPRCWLTGRLSDRTNPKTPSPPGTTSPQSYPKSGIRVGIQPKCGFADSLNRHRAVRRRWLSRGSSVALGWNAQSSYFIVGTSASSSISSPQSRELGSNSTAFSVELFLLRLGSGRYLFKATPTP